MGLLCEFGAIEVQKNMGGLIRSDRFSGLMDDMVVTTMGRKGKLWVYDFNRQLQFSFDTFGGFV